MAATTSNTTTTTTDETVVATRFLSPDGQTDLGTVTTTLRKTGSEYVLSVAFNVDSRLSGTDKADLTEYCEDAIEHFTAVKTALASA